MTHFLLEAAARLHDCDLMVGPRRERLNGNRQEDGMWQALGVRLPQHLREHIKLPDGFYDDNDVGL